MSTKILCFCMFVVLTAMLGACATTQSTVQVPRRFFWPPEPDQPRIEWITAYYGDNDIKEKGFVTSIVGEDSLIQFGRPTSVASDGEGRFVVVDQEKGQAYYFNISKREASPLGGSAEATSFTVPTGVAVDNEGNFYVADNVSRKIFVVNNKNSLLRVMDLSAQAKSIGNLTIDRRRSVLVIPDAVGCKVLYFNLKGELQSSVDGKGYFSYPYAVAVSSDGNLFVADAYNATIVRFSAEGKYINAIGKRGDSPGNLTLANGVAVDSEDHVYVTDGRLHNITIFDKDGNTLLVVGGTHSVVTGNVGRGGFLIPQGISIDKNDGIYVADSFNHRVQVLQYLNERYLLEHPLPTTGR